MKINRFPSKNSESGKKVSMTFKIGIFYILRTPPYF